MIPTDEVHIIFLDIALLTSLYFALTYFWIYPDAMSRGLQPKDYALLGITLIIFLNLLGILIWIVIYNDDRRKLPFKAMINRYWRPQRRRAY